jgi:aspartate racemase
MNKGRCLGLIGGLGVGAAIHYYRELARAHEKRGLTLDLVMAHAETSRVFEYAAAGDRDGLAEYLAGYIHRLKAAGAEAAAIPAVTPHFCIKELTKISPLPVFNIFEPLVRELAARSARRVAVFGTRFVMESALFGMAGDVQVVQAAPEEAAYIHDAYVKLAQLGSGSEELRGNLSALAHTLLERDCVDLIVLAGTDLALLFNEANTDFPHIDCAALHLDMILRGLERAN